MHDIPQHVKDAGDVLSIGAVIATTVGYLPEIAALFSIIWTGIRIYEWVQEKMRKGSAE